MFPSFLTSTTMFRAIFNNIGHDDSQLHLSLSTCSDRTISKVGRSCQSHKLRARMLQSSRIFRRIAKIKGPATRAPAPARRAALYGELCVDVG
ncbi:hypothetical protein AXF42_Ash015234 [Apostasia shenzhenica]|uniref:Uncharacterized protein n=1 Tax=Apostasia shenzhenica TaxID=1088818 RepID=A0A2I0AQV5_9ASPA|nr:hypothetical protein AXF42_Ash015234 [Apostasia shenzhenica]